MTATKTTILANETQSLLLSSNLRGPSYTGFPTVFRPDPGGPVADRQEVLHERRVSLQAYYRPVLGLESCRDLLAGCFAFAIARDYYACTTITHAVN